jgi:hypothetical protein
MIEQRVELAVADRRQHHGAQRATSATARTYLSPTVWNTRPSAPHGSPFLYQVCRPRRRGRGSSRARRPCHRPGAHRMEHGDDVARRLPGPRRRRRPVCRTGRPDERRPPDHSRLRRRRAGAAVRVLRRGGRRHRTDHARHAVLLAGQPFRPQLLHLCPLRHAGPGARCLDALRRRPGAVGRGLRPVRAQGLERRQHRHPDGRLVPQSDQQCRRSAGSELPHRRSRRRGVAAGRHERADHAGGRDLPVAAVGRARRGGMGGAVERPCPRPS